MCPFVEAPEGFSPEVLEMLDRAFAAAWHDLQMSHGPSSLSANDDTTRSAIERAVIDLAATGVREPERLKRHALHAARKSSPRKRPTIHLPA